MACSLQKLFSVEADFEDEEFLLAVKDVEKQTSDPPPANFRGLRPLSTALRAPSSTVTPAKDSGTILPSAAASPILSVQEQPRFVQSNCVSQIKCNQVAPLVSGFKIQKDHTSLTPECKSTSTSGTRFKFVKRQPPLLPSGGTPYDEEIDNDLVLAACMDLEGPGGQSCPRSFRSDGEAQEQLRNSSVAVAKKPRVADPSVRANSIGSENTLLKKTWEDTSTERVSRFQPGQMSSKVTLRPTATASCTSLPTPGVSSNTDTRTSSSSHMLKPLQMPLGRSIGECNRLGFGLDKSSSSFLSTPPRPSKPWIPNQSFPGSSKTSGGAQLLTAYGSPGVPVVTPSAISKAPLSTAAAGNLQTPVVTNHLVRLVTAANKTPQPAPHISSRTRVRRFPGPAGLLPHQPEGRNLEEILIATPQTPTHGALAKLQAEELPTSQQSAELEFDRGPWAAMKTEMGLDERDPSCFLRTYSAALKQLPKNKVPSMAVMVKTLTKTNVDAGAVFKDPTGEIQGTIHRLLLEEKESEIKAGSVLLLKQVGVFSPSHRNHYLNVTPSNLVKIYPPGYISGKSLQSCQEVRERMEMVPPQVVSEFQSTPPSVILDAMARTDYHTGESHEKDRNSSQHASSKESSLTPIPWVSRAVLNVPSPEAEKVDFDDLDQLLGELPDDFFSTLDAQNSL
ncbi:hypothetical protein JRQ81_004978 [Phrynocephalus forsythii]|uniref:Homologous recombination OB-fold protein OB-fold domain-containing protein n=1 Tax=Phrynocephalus forsythii TaxID=171643 RepID=A0A9Q1AVM0_9SAUR|nr:hypothetical protein JRQ81_004978 [Phrynocephalus forsythii]